MPTGLMLFSVVLSCATGLFAPACCAATKTWTGRDSGNWSGASNWRPAGAPQNGENLLFDPDEVESSVRKEMHNDIVGLQVGRIDFCDFGWTLDGNELTLLDRVGFRQSQTNTCADNSFRFDCPLKLGATTRMATAEGGGTLFLRGYIDLNGNDLLLHSGDQIFVSGQILGTGNVIATVDSFFGADSKIVFDGPTGNTFSGKLTIRQIYDDTGVVIFDKQFGHVVNDALLIGDRGFSLSARPAVCKLANSHQIGDAAEVCVTGGSQFLLDGHTETIGSLCLTNNGTDTAATLVDTGGSTLSVQGDIIAVNDAAGVVPTIKGKLGLPGPGPSGAKAVSSSTSRSMLRTPDALVLVPGSDRPSLSQSPQQVFQVTK